MSQQKHIALDHLIVLAKGLKSEHGENPEYDRALVELVTDAAGLSMEHRSLIASQIGVVR